MQDFRTSIQSNVFHPARHIVQDNRRNSGPSLGPTPYFQAGTYNSSVLFNSPQPSSTDVEPPAQGENETNCLTNLANGLTNFINRLNTQQTLQPSIPPDTSVAEAEPQENIQETSCCSLAKNVGGLVLAATIYSGFMAAFGAAGAAILLDAGYLVCLPAAGAAVGAVGGFIVLLLIYIICYCAIKKEDTARVFSSLTSNEPSFKQLLKVTVILSVIVSVMALSGFALLGPAAGLLSISAPWALASLGVGTAVFVGPALFLSAISLLSKYLYLRGHRGSASALET